MNVMGDKLKEETISNVLCQYKNQNSFSAPWRRFYKSLELFWKDEHQLSRYSLDWCFGEGGGGQVVCPVLIKSFAVEGGIVIFEETFTWFFSEWFCANLYNKKNKQFWCSSQL